jgi:hypothetical protein
MNALLQYSVSEPWLANLSNAWCQLFWSRNIPRDGAVVEVGPGHVPKVGHALSAYGFSGRLFVIEPSYAACFRITQSYRQLLPRAHVIPLCARVEYCHALVPTACDALVLNHVLDDLILGKSLSAKEFSNLFDLFSSSLACVDQVRLYWRRLAGEPKQLSIYLDQGRRDILNLIAHCHPRFIGISQYQSWVQHQNGLTLPDFYAVVLLEDLRQDLGEASDDDTRLLTRLGQQSERWLTT